MTAMFPDPAERPGGLTGSRTSAPPTALPKAAWPT